MKNTLKIVLILFTLIIILVVSLILLQRDQQKRPSDTGGENIVQEKEKTDQEKAEEFAEKMKSKIEEDLHGEDIYNFIKTITFEKDVSISPMGYVVVDGYVNNDPEKFHFSASLMYRSNEIGSMSYAPALADRFIDWEEYKDEPEIKENFLENFTKEEREQYLKDIGEKE